MSIKSKFLTLSMKEQICLTIIILTLFCLIVVLSICCSLSYEFLKEDYKNKRLYYFNKYKEYIESSFYFTNFCLAQYEEVIRRLLNQAYHFISVVNIFNHTKFEDYSDKIKYYDDTLHYNIENNKSSFYPELYLLCYWEKNDIPGFNFEHDYFCEIIKNETLKLYQSMANTFLFHDIYDYFRIPGYDTPLIDSQIFTNVDISSIFCFNASKIHNTLIDVQGQSTYVDHDKLYAYFHQKINEIISRIKTNNIKYLFQESNFLQHIFFKLFSKINFSLNQDILNNPADFYEYLSNIHYGNNTFSQIIGVETSNYFYSETKLIENFFFFLLNRLSAYLDMFYIPMFYENNTIVSSELCFLFLLNQIEFQTDNYNITELYDKIEKGKSNLEKCFAYKDKVNSQLDMKDILNLNFTSFLDFHNSIFQGIMYLTNNTNDFPFYFIKYSYPEYNILKDFRTEYLFLDQTDFFLFTSFKEPLKFSNYILQITQNCFLLIVVIILYIWILCLFVNLLIFISVINNWTDPIEKLQDAVESSSVIDENIFKYENDDIINELFGTCKELLSGQINNNENGLKNFNILSKSKDKQEKEKIDKNIYKKNLVINNDIMNKLIDQQQNMMDFSNNIKLNPQASTNEKEKISKKKKLNNLTTDTNSEKNLVSSSENKIKETNKNSTYKKNLNSKNSDKEDIEPYIKLFKIAEYLNAQSNKIETNNIFIIGNNSIMDESKMSKIISKNNKNVNNSIKRNMNLKSSIIRSDLLTNNENSENITINMLDEQNISYLWYMEAKKRNNKSFNYHISDNYKELFLDLK